MALGEHYKSHGFRVVGIGICPFSFEGKGERLEAWLPRVRAALDQLVLMNLDDLLKENLPGDTPLPKMFSMFSERVVEEVSRQASTA